MQRSACSYYAQKGDCTLSITNTNCLSTSGLLVDANQHEKCKYREKGHIKFRYFRPQKFGLDFKFWLDTHTLAHI